MVELSPADAEKWADVRIKIRRSIKEIRDRPKPLPITSNWDKKITEIHPAYNEILKTLNSIEARKIEYKWKWDGRSRNLNKYFGKSPPSQPSSHLRFNREKNIYFLDDNNNPIGQVLEKWWLIDKIAPHPRSPDKDWEFEPPAKVVPGGEEEKKAGKDSSIGYTRFHHSTECNGWPKRFSEAEWKKLVRQVNAPFTSKEPDKIVCGYEPFDSIAKDKLEDTNPKKEVLITSFVFSQPSKVSYKLTALASPLKYKKPTLDQIQEHKARKQSEATDRYKAYILKAHILPLLIARNHVMFSWIISDMAQSARSSEPHINSQVSTHIIGHPGHLVTG